MNLLSTIRDFFCGTTTPTLRNRAGGLAWINRNIDEGEGGAVLVNRIVRTVRLKDSDLWVIDPRQSYTVTHSAHNVIGGYYTEPGDRVTVVGIRDNALTPIPDAGLSDEEVRDLYAPAPTERAPARKPVHGGYPERA